MITMYKFLGKKGALYQLDLEPISIKLNYNCPKDYKNGEGEGSCKGYKPGSEKSDLIAKEKALLNKYMNAHKLANYKLTPEVKAIQKELQSVRDQISGKLSNTNISNQKIIEAKNVIEKVKSEKASGKVSKETKESLKTVIGELKNARNKNNQTNQTSEVNEKVTTGNKQEVLKNLSTTSNDKKLFNEFISSNKKYFKNTNMDIKDLSNPDITSSLINMAYFQSKQENKDYFSSVVKIVNDNAKTESDRSRIQSAVWMTKNLENGDYQKLQNWGAHDGLILKYEKGEKVDPIIAEMAKDIERIIENGPKYNGEVYRGIGNLNDKIYKDILNAKEFKWNTLSASTADKEVAMKYATGTIDGDESTNNNNSIVFKINKSKSGVYISDNASFSGLKEVLIPKDTKYKVLSVSDDKYTIDGKEYKVKVMELDEV